MKYTYLIDSQDGNVCCIVVRFLSTNDSEQDFNLLFLAVTIYSSLVGVVTLHAHCLRK